MGRIRTVKPEFWRHEELSALPEATHMLAAQLLNYADDEGYFNANPHLIQAEVSPLRAPSVSIPESLQKLAGIGWVRLGRGKDGKRYGHIVKFLDHQCISHPKPSKIKPVVTVWDEVRKYPDLFKEQSILNGTGNREQGTGNGIEPDIDLRERDFEEFLSKCPKQTGRGDARPAYIAALAKTTHKTIISGIDRYARKRKGQDEKFTLSPEKWLTGEHWADVDASTQSPEPDASELAAMWDGNAAKLLAIIRPAEFQAWFSDVHFDPGPPVHLGVKKQSARNMIERKYSGPLRRAFGEYVLDAAT